MAPQHRLCESNTISHRVPSSQAQAMTLPSQAKPPYPHTLHIPSYPLLTPSISSTHPPHPPHTPSISSHILHTLHTYTSDCIPVYGGRRIKIHSYLTSVNLQGSGISMHRSKAPSWDSLSRVCHRPLGRHLWWSTPLLGVCGTSLPGLKASREQR